MRKPAVPKGAKKVKRRNPWSEDESKSDSEPENSELVVPRENKSQRASGEAAPPPPEVVTRGGESVAPETCIDFFCVFPQLPNPNTPLTSRRRRKAMAKRRRTARTTWQRPR